MTAPRDPKLVRLALKARRNPRGDTNEARGVVLDGVRILAGWAEWCCEQRNPLGAVRGLLWMRSNCQQSWDGHYGTLDETPSQTPLKPALIRHMQAEESLLRLKLGDTRSEALRDYAKALLLDGQYPECLEGCLWEERSRLLYEQPGKWLRAWIRQAGRDHPEWSGVA